MVEGPTKSIEDCWTDIDIPPFDTSMPEEQDKSSAPRRLDHLKGDL
jgi:hypothetical protein